MSGDVSPPRSRIVGVSASGNPNSLLLDIIAGHIQAILALPVDRLPPFEPPEAAFHAVRNQYNAAVLLQELSARECPCGRILGVTSYDLFLPIFTHVYGEAQLPGRAAVISVFRLEGSPPSPREQFYERAAKVALHELLHTFGLTHCSHTHCLMHPVTKTDALDALPLYLCRTCLRLWEERASD